MYYALPTCEVRQVDYNKSKEQSKDFWQSLLCSLLSDVDGSIVISMSCKQSVSYKEQVRKSVSDGRGISNHH